MKICVVASCSSNSIQNPDLIWHAFPRDTFQREEWGDILGLRESEVTDQARVCSLHFKPKDYIANRNILKQHAIPSIRLGRKHVFSDDDDFEEDDEYYHSETEAIDVKDVQLISEEETVRSQVPLFEKIKVEPQAGGHETEKDKEVVVEEEKEPERRPSRRAARLAAEKISKTVKKYGLGNSSKCDDRFLDREDFKDKDYNYNPVFDRRSDPSFQVRKEKSPHIPVREKLQPVVLSSQIAIKKKEAIPTLAVKNSTPVRESRLTSFHEKRLDFTPSLISKTYNIDLIMECHEELLTSVQAEAILKEQMEYNMVMKTLRNLKNTNARIIYASANFADDNNDDDSKNTISITSTTTTPVVPAQLSTAQQYEASMNQRPGPKSSKIFPKPVQPTFNVTEPLITSVSPSITIRPTNGHNATTVVPTPIIIGQPQTILITTPNPTTTSVTTSDATSSNYKVLVDSRTGVVVGTLPSETTILQNSSARNVPSLNQNLKIKSESAQKDLIKTEAQEIISDLKQQVSKENESSSVPLIIGGFRMVTAQSLLSVKPCSLKQPDEKTIESQISQLKLSLCEDNFISDPVKWLIKIGLIPSDQNCSQCALPTELCSDKTAFDNYSWSCTKCKENTAIIRPKFFCRFGIPLSKLIHLTYYWAIQADASEVLKHVEVDIYMVRSVWRALQEVCTNTLAVKAKKIGGHKNIVEIGTAQIGRYFILGAYDRNTTMSRLRAVSISLGYNAQVFNKCLEPWLNAKSVVVSDDPKLEDMRTTNFEHVLVKSKKVHDHKYADNSNSVYHVENISNYLKQQLSNMFGKFWVNQLKLETVQGFIDELQWRERYGVTPKSAFWNILKDIGRQSGIQDSIQCPLQNNPPKRLRKVPPPSPSLPSSSVSKSPSVKTQRRTSRPILPGSLEKTVQNYKNRGRKSLTNKVALQKIQQVKRKRIRADVSVSLDEYYYARLEGDLETDLEKTEQKKNFQYKCHICKKILDNNIKVMKHINSHIENSRQHHMDLSDLTQCKYCFREFPTPYNMQCHIESVHLKENALVCRICSHAFTAAHLLVHHMKMVHCQSEMPYKCDLCKFRSSFHHDILEHFERVHNGKDAAVICQYCLKVYSIRFSTSGLGFTQNYYNHLYKHQSKSTRKCSCCCLVFLNLHELKAHKSEDHLSMKNTNGVTPIKLEGTQNITVLNPGEKPPKKLKSFLETIRSGKKQSKLDNTLISLSFQPEDSLTCIECRNMVSDDHFRKQMHCGQCKYSSNCSKAFANHMIYSHCDVSKRKPNYIIKPVMLKKSIVCICGYETKMGNLMTHHLAKCDSSKQPFCRVPFSIPLTLEDIEAKVKTIKTEPVETISDQSAFFPPLVVLDGNEELSISESFAKITSGTTTSEVKKESTEPAEVTEPIPAEADVETSSDSENMLNALGLVRKPSLSTASSTPSVHDENSSTSQDTAQLVTPDVPKVEEELIL